ncbi:MAG: rhodanese family protein [Erythrobacter sp.]
MSFETISAKRAKEAIEGGAVLVDIRSPQEHSREKIGGALNVPLEQIDALPATSQPTIYHCRSGMRTTANADQLLAASSGTRAFLLEGGIDGWRSAGFGTELDRSQPIDIMRQVQIAAGSLVIIGTLLAILLNPLFLAIPLFVGCGLVFAGSTGWCGIAKLLGFLPWNRAAGT